MNREQSLKEWKDAWVEPNREVYRKKFQELILGNQEKLRSCIMDAMKKAAVQKKEPAVFHFQYSRTAALMEKDTLLLGAYDRTWFLDEAPFLLDVDFSLFFSPFFEWKKLLDEKRKIYRGKVSRYDVLEVLNEERLHCFLDLEVLLRDWCSELDEEDWVKEAALAPSYQVRLGDYMEEGEILFAMDESQKTTDDLLKHLKEGKPLFYTAWKESELSGVKLSGQDLLFLNFKKSHLDGLDFTESKLFRNRFKEAELTGCRFTRTKCMYSLFQKAVLTGCDFTEADLTGTDFQDAVLEQNEFDGANLAEAVFSRDAVPFLHLSAEQMQQIRIV